MATDSRNPVHFGPVVAVSSYCTVKTSQCIHPLHVHTKKAKEHTKTLQLLLPEYLQYFQYLASRLDTTPPKKSFIQSYT